MKTKRTKEFEQRMETIARSRPQKGEELRVRYMPRAYLAAAQEFLRHEMTARNAERREVATVGSQGES